MLGERGRLPSFRRTTSMTGISVEVADMEVPPSELLSQSPLPHFYATGFRTPRFGGRGSGDFQMETAHFLKSCGLCNRNLAPSSDIYMYRGDTAFCSVECREQLMKQEEVKERRASSNISGSYRPEVAAAAAAAEASDTNPTAVAA